MSIETEYDWESDTFMATPAPEAPPTPPHARPGVPVCMPLLSGRKRRCPTALLG